MLNIRLRLNISSEDSNGNEIAIPAAVEDSFAAMVDDISAAHAASQVLHADETGDETKT